MRYISSTLIILFMVVSLSACRSGCEAHADKYSKTDGTSPESFTTDDMMEMLCRRCVQDGGTDCY